MLIGRSPVPRMRAAGRSWRRVLIRSSGRPVAERKALAYAQHSARRRRRPHRPSLLEGHSKRDLRRGQRLAKESEQRDRETNQRRERRSLQTSDAPPRRRSNVARAVRRGNASGDRGIDPPAALCAVSTRRSARLKIRVAFDRPASGHDDRFGEWRRNSRRRSVGSPGGRSIGAYRSTGIRTATCRRTAADV